VSRTTYITSRSTYRRFWLIAASLALLLSVATPQLFAEDKKQEASTSDEAPLAHIPRKLVRKVDPIYPQDLKRRSIGGTVKLDLKIAANGNVERISIVGGNPILADSAAQAVKQWRYAPASTASGILLNVEFNPNR
jgi:TonB family protein